MNMSSRTLSLAVEEQLRSLCLKDFPCGHGCWSKSRGNIFEEQSWGYIEQDEGREGAAKEEQEALMEHLTSPLSPWRHEESWSPQALTLTELSVRTPELLHGNFIFSHFNTLRIVDKGVSIVDDGLLRFSSLRELVLSANKMSELQAEYLPCTLQVLELYANQVSSLKGLCSQPLPCLQHLGLGCNRHGSPADIQYLTGTLWPRLVSLDLSWSGFQGQQALVDALATLPCLRTLVLEGNPLTFTPSYPGFILDSLPRLLYLGATRVTPDDHHRFGGLAKMRGIQTRRYTKTQVRNPNMTRRRRTRKLSQLLTVQGGRRMLHHPLKVREKDGRKARQISRMDDNSAPSSLCTWRNGIQPQKPITWFTHDEPSA
ncbi:leucine-rich repeat-containing protein 43-like isoform X3 [Coregonus clupeaformis]|uniref:leucine-rich repeat-containing protein 43-like isoform X3 n=1 Tax=Coregonus clupeaformis TaxID=59861 RepID=UPI001E1C53AE|nr:leucine-rich repeat-containing protein 43-like isoform X3 [Coregonus clupeaformis]